MKFINHCTALKVNFSTGLERMSPFRFYEMNIIHALIPGKRELKNEVNAQLPFAEFNNCLRPLGSPELRLNIPQLMPQFSEHS